jgi:ribosome-binding ATPase YchF (GTP1/OBG family)
LIRIGIIGKTNAGKTTFFNAATLKYGEISSYPFTTKEPQFGIGYVRALCPCRELKVKDDPRNSFCVDGWRFIPIELIDLPGLIKGSWSGKGLGTQFLSVAAQADALLHIVDASGSIDAEGRLTKPGMGNPVLDVYDIEVELLLWFSKLVKKAVERASKRMGEAPPEEVLGRALGGMKVRREHIARALEETGLVAKPFDRWSDTDIREFSGKLRDLSKPTIIIANKMDLAKAEENYERLKEEFQDKIVIPCCSEAELALRRAEQRGYVKYVPGEEAFKVLADDKLTKEQRWALNYFQERVFSKIMRTGVQFALNVCVFKLLGMNAVYPVEDASRFSNGKGRVLPDAFLMPPGSTARDLAERIHSDLAKGIIFAIDAKSGLRLPSDYVLRDGDVIKIVAATKRG